MADYGRTRIEQRFSPTPIVSMEDAYIDQFGRTLYELFFQRYSEKVWGLPCSEMSGDWVTQRSKGMSLVTAVKDAIVPSKGKVVSLIDNFMYPKYGFGRFSERMADAHHGHGQFHPARDRGREGASRGESSHRASRVSTPNGPQRIEAANYISSIPADGAGQDRRSGAPDGRHRGGESAHIPQRDHRQHHAQEAAA